MTILIMLMLVMTMSVHAISRGTASVERQVMMMTVLIHKLMTMAGSFVLQVLIFHLVESVWDGHSGNKHRWDQSHCLPSQSPTNHPQIFWHINSSVPKTKFYVCGWDLGGMKD